MIIPPFYPPNVAEIVPVGSCYMVILNVDLHKMEGAYKLFTNYHDALLWKHDGSLAQCPEWHKEHCRYCKEGRF